MRLRIALLVLVLVALATSEQTRADGTEGLGVPSIPLAAGSGISVAGIGMNEQPAALTVTVPAGAVVKQVLLYWEGFMLNNGRPDDTLRVASKGASVTVTGTLIGGPAFFYYLDAWASSFRADITSLGLVTAGENTLMLDDMAFTVANNGAGIVVIYDDGGALKRIDARDGIDLAYIGFPEPRKSTVRQTFSFAPLDTERVAHLDLFVASISGALSGPLRPTSVEIITGGRTNRVNNQLGSHNGDEWDTLSIPVTIPAGAANVTVQAFSRDDLRTGNLPASFDWVAAFFSIDAGGVVGDTVYCDLNGNGAQDAGESGIPGVKVKLVAFDSSGAAIGTGEVITDSNGHYRFVDVPPGEFEVSVDLSTLPTDCSAPICPVTVRRQLAAGEAYLQADFCFTTPPPPGGQIGDTIYCDTNGNGVQDAGEEGIAGVKVILTPLDGLGLALVSSELITDTDGHYRFVDLPAGNFEIAVDLSTLPVSCSDPVCPATVRHQLAAGEIYLDADFCFKSPPPGGQIGDIVYCDLNANGGQDPGELGIAGVKVKLTSLDTPGPAPVTAEVITDANGFYRFIEVPAGNFEVTVDVRTLPADCNVPVCPVVVRHLLAEGEIFLNADFCFTRPPLTGRIGDTVYCDLNANGVQDPGDLGIRGVTIHLLCRDADGHPVAGGVAVTDDQGKYMFLDVPDGHCEVRVSLRTLPSDCNVPVCPFAVIFNVAPGEVRLDADFCFTKSARAADHWKNRFTEWPVQNITIGERSYTRTQATQIMYLSDKGDKAKTLFRHLISAKLNVLSGTNPDCIASDIAKADAWLTANPVLGMVPNASDARTPVTSPVNLPGNYITALPTQVNGKSDAWAEISSIATRLDRYNNGLLCAPQGY